MKKYSTSASPEEKGHPSHEYRCSNCNKLLALGDTNVLGVEIKCGRCGFLNYNDDIHGQAIAVNEDKK